MNAASVSSTTRGETSYGFHCELDDKEFGLALARVTEALRAEGFGACNPPLAHRALEAEPDPSAAMQRGCSPGGRRRLGRRLQDRVAVLQMTSNTQVATVAREVDGRLQRIRASLTASTRPNTQI